jgi:hypothetical protein
MTTSTKIRSLERKLYDLLFQFRVNAIEDLPPEVEPDARWLEFQINAERDRLKARRLEHLASVRPLAWATRVRQGRERTEQVRAELARTHSRAEIARRLGIHRDTVRTHIRLIEAEDQARKEAS